MRIAIVGAGIAGLSCAAGLRGRGHAVALFDKGARPGGRVATRRAGALRFNHGAQYATARGEGFAAVLAGLRAEGAVRAWPAAGEGCWVGAPDMAALPARLAATCGADLHRGRQVTGLTRDGAGWALRHHPAAAVSPGAVAGAGGTVAGFDAVLLALPHAQAAPLLRDAGHAAFAALLDGVAVAPCWTLMAAFATPVPGPDAGRPAGGGPLAWIARENGRPGQAREGPDRWVAHATPAWSRAWTGEDPEAAAAALLAAFAGAAGGAVPLPVHRDARRWRYALTEVPLGRAALWDGAARLGVCGDWCLGGRVEAAWDSGAALAALAG